MTSRNLTVAIFAFLLLTIPTQAAEPPTGTVRAAPECASAKTAVECADILRRLGKNPFDAFDYPDPVYAAQNQNVSHSYSLTAAQWVQVASVFLAAFLGMCTGVVLEFFKNWRADVKTSRQKLQREVQQINGVIAGIGFNIETLLHLVMQNILPHHRQSHAAYKALCELPKDGESIKQFAISLHQYPALMMTCPELHFIESDFWKEIPFIIEKDPELVKQFGWLMSYAREIQNATGQRSKNIQAARILASQQGGGLNFYVLDSVLQLQASISNSECVTALEFFRVCLRMARNLEDINHTYKIRGKKTTLIPPPPLPDAMNALKKIADKFVPQMPT